WLSRVVAQQSQEIETLKDRIARIEQALGTRTAASVQPIAYTPAVQATPSVASQTVPAAPAPAGFRFSGDLRLRLDATVRGASPAATGLQNIRGRYRFRFNADRDVSPDLTFHAQVSTGAVNNGLTFDQD